MEKERDVIIACDFGSGKQALEFLDKFAGEDRKPFVKIGRQRDRARAEAPRPQDIS